MFQCVPPPYEVLAFSSGSGAKSHTTLLSRGLDDDATAGAVYLKSVDVFCCAATSHSEKEIFSFIIHEYESFFPPAIHHGRSIRCNHQVSDVPVIKLFTQGRVSCLCFIPLESPPTLCFYIMWFASPLRLSQDCPHGFVIQFCLFWSPIVPSFYPYGPSFRSSFPRLLLFQPPFFLGSLLNSLPIAPLALLV